MILGCDPGMVSGALTLLADDGRTVVAWWAWRRRRRVGGDAWILTSDRHLDAAEGPALWTVLDSTEGPQYHRREVTVRSEDGRDLAACIYWYTGALDRGVPIPSGDYRAHAPATSIYHQPSP